MSRLNRIPRIHREEGQPMPAEAWSDHEDANEQFNGADGEFWPRFAGAVAAVVAVVSGLSYLVSNLDWT